MISRSRISATADISVDLPSVVPLAENPSGIGQKRQQRTRIQNLNVVAANAKRVNVLEKKRKDENAKNTSVGPAATIAKKKRGKDTVTGGAKAKVDLAARVRVPRLPLRACPRARVNGSKSLCLQRRSL